MIVSRKDLAPGIHLTAIQTDKFKSATLSATFLAPLTVETASANAIVPYVLRRGCGKYPAMEQVSAALDELYGGMLDAIVRKKGETQCLGLLGSFLDEPYTLEGERVLEPAARLLTQLILDPVTENGAFREDYVEGEKENLIHALRAQVNDKRSYAAKRLLGEMCQEEPYGIDRLGREEDVEAITPQSAWNAYQSLLAHAPLELHYCGSASAQQVEAAFTPLVNALWPRRGKVWTPRCETRPHAPAEPRTVVEHLDVTQGKLSLGFRTGGVTAWTSSAPALLVFSALYGGSSTSKLFLNVRERLSLCYYASSAVDAVKGLLLVSSGVEFDKLDEAQAEILAQLQAIQKGDFTAEELDSARQTVVNVYQSALDNRAQLEQYWLNAAVTGLDEPPEELVERLKAVTAQEVQEVAQGIELDTVYRLVGKEKHA